MRISHLLFAASAVLLAIVVAGFFLSAPLLPAAGPHPEYESIERTIAGSEGTLWWGYAMGLAILAVLGVSTVLGVRRRGPRGRLGRWLAVGFACLGIIFTGLVSSYARYASGTGADLVLGVPPPTAWMLYGVWLFPFLMILVSILHFDGYVSEDDERQFEELMRRRPPEGKDTR